MRTLFISDLDGTLLSNDALPSNFTVRTVNSLIERGLNFSVATSRSMHDANKILPHFNFKTPVITMNGTFITDIENGRKTLHHSSIDKSLLSEIIEILTKNNCPPNVYTFSDEGLSIEYIKMSNPMQDEFFKEREFSYNSFKKVDKYDLSGDVVFLSIIACESEVKPAAEEIAKKFPSVHCACYKDTYNKDGWFIEVSAKTANKADALKKLKEIGGFDRVVAFGDNLNDIPLFSVADLKIAVKNAREELKQIADLVIEKNTEDAVAKYLLNQFKEEI